MPDAGRAPLADEPHSPTAHGGLLDAELGALGLHAGDVLDVSVNVNPYGPCASVRRAIAEAAIDRYPDPTAAPAAARDLDRPAWASTPGASWSATGPSISSGPSRAPRFALGDRVLIVEPAFSEMRSAALRPAGPCASIVEHRTRPENDFALDLGALDDQLEEFRPRLAYVCTPSNPAGVCVPVRRRSRRLAARHPETLFVVDVSFLSMSTRHADAEVAPPAGIVWVRSLTKDHALAGLRIGYAVASAALAEQLENHRPPWSVNALAQAAAIATTRDEARRFVADSRARWLEDRVRLATALTELGLRVHPSEAVYVLADLGDGERATDLRHRLLRQSGVLVRDATSFGLPHHIRIGARPPRDLERFLHALRRELHP